MEAALGPLDIVSLSKEKEKSLPKTKPLTIEALAKSLESILKETAEHLRNESGKNFLYKHPNGWKRKHFKTLKEISQFKPQHIHPQLICENASDESSFATPNSSTSSKDKDSDSELEPWALIKDFEYRSLTHQINEFIRTWELTPATKYVVIAQEKKIEHVTPYGERYFAEAHFSKPTPKCPNPLAVAKVYFYIHVSNLLPNDYPVNVTYRFEGYKTEFNAMGIRKIIANKFQNYFINSIIHMKLAFYAKLCRCRNPVSPGWTAKKSSTSEGTFLN